jgi:hypothetical protein
VQGVLLPPEEKNGTVGESLAELPTSKPLTPERHREAVANRLKRLLQLLNERRRSYPLIIPEIATLLGLSAVTDIESYFLGEKDAPFDLLDQIADTFGLSPNWLKFGHRQPFQFAAHGFRYNRGSLLGIVEDIKPQQIFFVRCLNRYGYASVAFRLTDWKYQATHDGWHVSNHVGMTGTWQLYDLWQSIKTIVNTPELYRITVGRDLPEHLYLPLIQGEAFPGAVLEDFNSYQSYWFDDFIDIDHEEPIARDGYLKYGEGFVQAQELVRYCRDSEIRKQQELCVPLD